ncbi:Bax inhibitor-1/YccA family protein [Pseudarthrobacter sp. J75]|uniref:Bax inhibitor-1/YccA family protein n=1 Tax=unclassified Pseudarthrobacter TaxID=2647000 RepID=UPI002E80D7C3|nr:MULTISPECIES: Bax inhibitor-1/YccA family protein [unclassified Pseudarthrobacter]MEE2521602.1 Bax inhibitor-1/YccA family protein [Pseudarthrobacter sp. J47]MEE2527679.1 Bax inhibitor-1/YccA family protein [Pseudarthrobacter sp. J75]MEE2570844.1 Bax inhibitor-1/YccA family protein [Pseudarthrobacter sp. J64]
MALGGNPIFNGKNFRGATQAPPVPQAPWGNQGAYGTQTQYGAPPQAMSQEQLQDLYNRPAAGPLDTGRMSYDDVIVKTFLCLGAVLVGAAVTLFVSMGLATMLMIVGALGGFALAMVNTFKKQPSPALILAYAALEGLFLGGLTRFIEASFGGGLGLQAVLGTLSVFAVTLVLFKSGKVRATPKAMRFFMIAMIGYAVFSVVNLVMMWTGVTDNPFGMRSGIVGILIGLLAIGLAAFSLIMDFTSIEAAVQSGAPERFAWTAAFGLTVTLVWLYVEIIRLLAILRGEE